VRQIGRPVVVDLDSVRPATDFRSAERTRIVVSDGSDNQVSAPSDVCERFLGLLLDPSGAVPAGGLDGALE
jgi:hypothetical protein